MSGSRPQLHILLQLNCDRQLMAKLDAMDKGASQIARSAVSKGIRIIAKAQKAALPQGFPKSSVGSRNKKVGSGGASAKAGVHVGTAATAGPGRRGGLSRKMPQAHL